jgi:hypothetical protein
MQSGSLYEVDGVQATRFRPVLHKVQTRSGPQYWIDTTSGENPNLIPQHLVPTMIIHQPRLTGSLASVVHSQNSFPASHDPSLFDQTGHHQIYEALLHDDDIPYEELERGPVRGLLSISVSTSGRKSTNDIMGHLSFYNSRSIYTDTHRQADITKYKAEPHSLYKALLILPRVTDNVHQASISKCPILEVTIIVSQKHINAIPFQLTTRRKRCSASQL